jgi:hypothetical protein
VREKLSPREIHALKVERDTLNPYDEAVVADLTARINAAEQALGGKVFRVPVANLPGLLKQITQINRRAAKLDLSEVRLELYDTETVKYQSGTDNSGAPVTSYREFKYVVLVGETPRVAGFEFVATLEHDDAGTIVRRVPTFGAKATL